MKKTVKTKTKHEATIETFCIHFYIYTYIVHIYVCLCIYICLTMQSNIYNYIVKIPKIIPPFFAKLKCIS